MRSSIFVAFALSLWVLCSACASAPPTATAEQYFATVKNNLTAQDYEAGLNNLDRLIEAAGDSSLGQQGRVLRIALLTALADGKKQMAEAYGQGRNERLGRPRRAEFTKIRADYYRDARDRLVAAMEAFLEQRGKLSEQPIPLEVPFPAFSEGEHGAIARIKRGLSVGDDARSRAELQSIRNALARIMTRLVGEEDDLHKAQEIFHKGDVQVDTCCYLIEMSRTLTRTGEIFDPIALNDSRFRRISYEIARDNIEAALELMGGQPDKQLVAKAKRIKAECEKSLKALRE